jgi:uncharacterized sulfatase
MATRPNIVWLTLDSVRADHTSLAGYDRDTTPNLRRIADSAEGSSFNSCFSAGISTPQSSASILTGTYPFRHGLAGTNDYLPDQLRTVPELLGERGYTTACVSRNSYVSAGTGLDRGFDHFRWIAASSVLRTVPPRALLSYLVHLRQHSAGFTIDTSKHATPYLVNKTAGRVLDDVASAEPFFLYVHYNEPHRPYFPPLPYLDRYTDDLGMSTVEAAKFSMWVHRNLNEIVADGCHLDRGERRALKAMYDAEIAYTDMMVGAFVERVRSLEVGDTIFVITADHGELFGEHGMLAHKVILDDAVLHVPLVVHGLTDVAEQRKELVQHIDVMQTLLGLAGADTEQFQGVDLRNETREYVFAQRGQMDFSQFLKQNSNFDTSPYHGAPVAAIRDHRYKFQRSDERCELFMLSDESTDVADRHPDVATSLDAALDDWLKSDGQPIDADGESRLTGAMRRQLRDLGYLE